MSRCVWRLKRPPRPAAVQRRLGAWAKLAPMLLVLAILCLPHTARSQQSGQSPDAPEADISPALMTLLDPQTPKWMEALGQLRIHPDSARIQLLAAVRSQKNPPRRWRLYHHLVEFGLEQDIPIVLEKLRSSNSAWESRILRGVARALYRPVRDPEEYPALVEEFAYLQTSGPRVYRAKYSGKLVIASDVIMEYHRMGVHPRIIRKMMRFTGRAFDTKNAVVKAIRSSFGRRDWNRNWKILLDALSPTPELMESRGVLRIGVYNPNPRPILVEAEFDAWYGRFEKHPDPLLIYVPAEKSSVVDFDVRLIGQPNYHPLRIDLRLRESGGARVTLGQKIQLTF